MKKYIPGQIEPKWQKKWREDKLYEPDLDQAPNPYYNLMMFPYPSAEGLHVGNMYPFTGSDIFGRYKRMQGFNVFEPIGLDGFGIHSENYAMQVGKHPLDMSEVTEKRFYEQLSMIGDAYAWDHTVETYKPDYYKWTQWLFLQMYKKGLAYRKKASVNWCPKDKTVLADEQVVNGLCERCASKVEQRLLEQWFFRITDYAERLLKNLETIDWSEKVKIAQKNWIGKSEGVIVKFGELEVFTTRLDTIFGATFVVVSPEHQFVTKLKSKEVKEYVQKAKKQSELERKENKEKTGVFSGEYVKNPLTTEDMPVWVADYVLTGYGTGAVMGVPAHDKRDFEFANKFNLPIKKVIEGDDLPYEGEGVLVDSGKYTGMTSAQARQNIPGKKQSQYHLRDWLISRQRYWGPPIPIIYCDKCGIVPVPEKDLPVELPYIKDFRPTGAGQSPLASVPDFYNVTCPKCSGQAKRETDVSDTFLDSSWYFLRYPSTQFNDVAFDEQRTKKWLPVDMYIGGAEHSVLHLLYARFVTMVLNDLGYIDFEEPFKTFFAHGLIIKDGAKMSKSKGNVINPDKYIQEYGADTLRTYLMFMGPLSEGGDFRDGGMNGTYRFLQRTWGLQEKVTDSVILSETKDLKIKKQKSRDSSPAEWRTQNDNKRGLQVGDLRIMHKTIKKVTEDVAGIKFNTAIASLMEWLNHLSRKEKISLEEYKTYLLLLAPFAPHITEELWQILRCHPEERSDKGWSIHQQSWPKSDNKYLEEKEISVAVQVNGKVRDILVIGKDMIDNKEVVEKMAMASKKAQKFLEGKSVEKIVYIPGRIISFVLSS